MAKIRTSRKLEKILRWKMIKGKKELYDKMMNMKIDQLVLSIEQPLFIDNPAIQQGGQQGLPQIKKMSYN